MADTLAAQTADSDKQKSPYALMYRSRNKDRLKEIESRSKRKAREENPIQNIFWAARTRSKKIGMEFSIELKDLDMPLFCPLLGIPIYIVYGRRNANSPSIDRIDNTKGYIKGNVWVISWRANDLKKNATLEELEMITKNLASKLEALTNG